MQSHFWVFFGSIWLAVGLPFVLLAGYFIVQERQLATTGRVVEAMVLTKDIGRSGDNVIRSVRYRFTSADGGTIEGKSANRPSVSHVVGTSELTLLLIFSFVGGLLSIAGGTIVTVALGNARTRRRLLTAGVRAPATVAEVKAMNLRVNGRTQWRLKYEYQGRAFPFGTRFSGGIVSVGSTGEALYIATPPLVRFLFPTIRLPWSAIASAKPFDAPGWVKPMGEPGAVIQLEYDPGYRGEFIELETTEPKTCIRLPMYAIGEARRNLPLSASPIQ